MLVFYLLLLFLLLGPLLFGRAVQQLGRSEQLMLPGARAADGWDLEALKAYPERVEQLRGWVERILITWAPMDDRPRHRMAGGYLNPYGPTGAPPIFQATFRDVNGEMIHLGASPLYESIAQDARWLAAVLQVPLEDDVAEGRPARVNAHRALPAPGGQPLAPGGPGPGYEDYPTQGGPWAGPGPGPGYGTYPTRSGPAGGPPPGAAWPGPAPGPGTWPSGPQHPGGGTGGYPGGTQPTWPPQGSPPGGNRG